MEYQYEWIIRFSITEKPYRDRRETFRRGEKLFKILQIPNDKWAKKQGLNVDGGWALYEYKNKIVWKCNLTLYQNDSHDRLLKSKASYDRLPKSKAKELVLFAKNICNELAIQHDDNFKISPFVDSGDRFFSKRMRDGYDLIRMGRKIKRKKGMGRYGRSLEKWGKRKMRRTLAHPFPPKVLIGKYG